MAAKRKTTRRPASRSGRSSGSRVSGSATVNIHLFSGLFTHFSLFRAGGGGGRGRGGGLLKRLAKSAAKTFGELQGKPSGPASAGSKGGRSFEAFQASRPDLFDDQNPNDVVDDQQEDDMSETTGPRPSRTERDRRFFALRESGYRGPINQDGYAVDDDPDNYAIGCPNGCDPTFGHRASCEAGRLL